MATVELWEKVIDDHTSLTLSAFQKGDFSELFQRFPVPERQVREKHSGAVIENFNFGTTALKSSQHTVTYVIAAASNVDSTVKEKLKGFGDDRTTGHKEASGIMKTCADNIKKDAENGGTDTEDWEKTIDADTEKSKAKDTETIENAASKVKDYIKNNVAAGSRQDAANFWVGISTTITSVVADVWKAIQDAFEAVIAWIKDAWEKVKQAFVDIGNWFASLFEAIAKL